MWLWLQSMRPQNHKQTWYWVAFGCLVAHLLFLIFSFRYQGREPLNLTVFASARTTEVVFVPSYKRVPGAQGKLAQGPAVKAGSGSVIKGSSKKSNRDARVKSSSVKPAPKNSPIKLDTYTVPAKSAGKSKSKAKSSPKEPKLQEQVVPAAVAEVKPVIKPAAQPGSALDLTTKNLKPALKLLDDSDQVAAGVESGADNGPMYLGLGSDGAIALGREDLVAWQAAQELESVIVQAWRPPSGLSKELVCQVQLTIDQTGQVANFEIKQGSGVFAYDLSVRQALPKLTFPESVRGKILVIAFKQ